jgi:TonB family protein
MRCALVEPDVDPAVSSTALLLAASAWGLLVLSISAGVATGRARATRPDPSAGEHARFVLPPLPARVSGDDGLARWFGGAIAAPRPGGSAPPGGSAGRRGRPAAVAERLPPDHPAGTGGTVYAESEVDRPVIRDPSSAAPEYPAFLQAEHVEGFVIAEFVVDTTGVPDVHSLHIVMSSHPAFEQSLREALPHMRFLPAALDGHAVRQRVRQEFDFEFQPGLAPPLSTS